MAEEELSITTILMTGIGWSSRCLTLEKCQSPIIFDWSRDRWGYGEQSCSSNEVLGVHSVLEYITKASVVEIDYVVWRDEKLEGWTK